MMLGVGSSSPSQSLLGFPPVHAANRSVPTSWIPPRTGTAGLNTDRGVPVPVELDPVPPEEGPPGFDPAGGWLPAAGSAGGRGSLPLGLEIGSDGSDILPD